MKIYISTYLVLFACIVGSAQNSSIAGKITGPDLVPVESASIRMYQEGDSSAEQEESGDGTISNDSGYFSIPNLDPGDYLLVISNLNYEDQYLSFNLEARTNMDLGSIPMVEKVHALEEITVAGSGCP